MGAFQEKIEMFNSFLRSVSKIELTETRKKLVVDYLSEPKKDSDEGFFEHIDHCLSYLINYQKPCPSFWNMSDFYWEFISNYIADRPSKPSTDKHRLDWKKFYTEMKIYGKRITNTN